MLSPSAGSARSAPIVLSMSAADGGRSKTGPDRTAAISCSANAVTLASRAWKSASDRSSEVSRRSGSCIGGILPAQGTTAARSVVPLMTSRRRPGRVWVTTTRSPEATHHR